MIEVEGDAWEMEADVLCVTTNGTVTEQGANIMGGGIAGEASRRYNWLPYYHGILIYRFGVHCYLVPAPNEEKINGLLMFPTKRVIEEGADIDLILNSMIEAAMMADMYGWQRILLPRPGAGLGGLDWASEVKPVLERAIDDRFTVVSYPGEDERREENAKQTRTTGHASQPQ